MQLYGPLKMIKYTLKHKEKKTFNYTIKTDKFEEKN